MWQQVNSFDTMVWEAAQNPEQPETASFLEHVKQPSLLFAGVIASTITTMKHGILVRWDDYWRVRIKRPVL